MSHILTDNPRYAGHEGFMVQGHYATNYQYSSSGYGQPTSPSQVDPTNSPSGSIQYPVQENSPNSSIQFSSPQSMTPGHYIIATQNGYPAFNQPQIITGEAYPTLKSGENGENGATDENGQQVQGGVVSEEHHQLHHQYQTVIGQNGEMLLPGAYATHTVAAPYHYVLPEPHATHVPVSQVGEMPLSANGDMTSSLEGYEPQQGLDGTGSPSRVAFHSDQTGFKQETPTEGASPDAAYNHSMSSNSESFTNSVESATTTLHPIG